MRNEVIFVIGLALVMICACVGFSLISHPDVPGGTIVAKEPPTPMTKVEKIGNYAIASVPRLRLDYKMYGLVDIERSGSGVAIASKKVKDGYETYILTAAHVVALPDYVNGSVLTSQFFIDGVGGDLVTSQVVAIDNDDDIALIKLTSKKQYPISKLASSGPKVKICSGVYAVGCKLGMMPTPTDGIITSKKFDGPVMSRLWGTSAPCIYGNSGGGVFLKSTGELVGIVSIISMVRTQLYSSSGMELGGAVYSPVAHMSYIVPLPKIKEFLRTSGNKWILGE